MLPFPDSHASVKPAEPNATLQFRQGKQLALRYDTGQAKLIILRYIIIGIM